MHGWTYHVSKCSLTQIISSSRWEGSGSVEACFCYLLTATSQFWPACHHHDPARILPEENPTRQRFSSGDNAAAVCCQTSPTTRAH